MIFQKTQEFAVKMDKEDTLKRFREKFHFPQFNNQNVLYFTGNSLGLQPKSTKAYLLQELDDWAKFGVEGHFHAKNPWYSYHELFSEPLSKITGAYQHEVVAMNQLTSNLHFLMASFYRPDKKRNKILCEAKAFPSDQYALQTQAAFHGFDPDNIVVEIEPDTGSHLIDDKKIINKIQELGEELAVVLIGGVNYFSGQVFDMKAITEAAHKSGAICGFDLAHAVGNIKLNLHEWNIDFAAWCSYKYLNSGPGSVAGVFIHEKHAKNTELIRLGGWWGHDKNERFKMHKNFKPIASAEGWQLSNAPVLSMAAHKASLDIFMEAGMDNLCKKSELLTEYLEFVIQEINKEQTDDKKLEIITPGDTKRRGCQLSIVAHGRGKKLFTNLTENGVITDWREPNVIRMAPVPLYNSFEDVGQVLSTALNE
jgi:kynureninase